jgi:hypothetical protein
MKHLRSITKAQVDQVDLGFLRDIIDAIEAKKIRQAGT